MNEITCNLHIHTRYSDGTGNIAQIAEAAIDAGVDVVITTDHNVKVNGLERYVEKNNRRVLVLTGEEVHDANRMPQKNHMLVIDCDLDAAPFASDPQELINVVNHQNGLTFLAHPYECALPLFHETDITWEDWDVTGFTGLELWNGFSEFKTVVHTLPQAIRFAFSPERIPHQPLSQTLAKWDELLARGHKVVAVAGSDSHALKYRFGIIRKTIFPYRYHFSTINNHLLLNEPLTGELARDKMAVYDALKKGAGYIAFELPASPMGFSFTAENSEEIAGLGDELRLDPGATLRVRLPKRAYLRLIHNGNPLLELTDTDRLVKIIDQPGAYRVEAYLEYLGKRRGWIFSNPIYVVDQEKPNRLSVA